MAYISNGISKKINNAYKGYNKALKATKQNSYEDQRNDLLNRYTNRAAFEYDPTKDASYQAVLNQYTNAGKQAMQDTIAASAALTGGYGNSYGQVAGQQQYNAHLSEAAAQIPALYEAAYNKYNQESTDLANQLNTIQGLYDAENTQKQNNLSNAFSWLTYLQGVADNEQAFNYQREQDNKNYALSLAAANGSSKKSSSTSSKKSSSGKKTAEKVAKKATTSGLKGVETVTSKSAIDKDMLGYERNMIAKYSANGVSTEASDYINSLYKNGKISKAQRTQLRESLKAAAKRNNAILNTGLFR